MIDTHQRIENVLSLPSIDASTVGAALGVLLVKESENPYWVFFEGAPNGQYQSVSLNLSKEGHRWLVAWQDQEVRAPFERDLNLERYGKVLGIQANPRIMPEGTVTYEYAISGLKLLIEFTAKSRRLRSVALHSD